jgi:hypothetical protein
MKTLEMIATVLAFIVLGAGILLLFGASLTAFFHVAGWHLPWSVVSGPWSVVGP